jgi:CRISPR system Cascade subunit CasD
MNEPYLLLWLEAPLQAWGHDSKFGRRDSLEFPTKSGVLGILSCAMGLGGPQHAWLAAWADLDMQLAGYVRSDHKGQALPRLPLLRDFQMVGSGYDDQDPWQSLHIPKKSNGDAPKKNANSSSAGVKIIHRYYVQDMAYAVAMQAPTEQVHAVELALQSPVWDLYLGRKNCAPTEFIFQGVFSSSDAALAAGDALAADKDRRCSLRVLQGAHDGEVLMLNDVPLQFGEHKLYRDRQVTVQRQS